MHLGLLGANGKVGMELALLLQATHPEVEVTCFVRSPYSTVLFERAGLRHRVVDFGDHAALVGALAPCDVVVDLTYPSGQTSEIADALRATVEAAIAAVRPGATYVYLSSVSAFGMPNEASPVMRDYRLARTAYARIKRFGERFATTRAQALGVVPYVFRLGQTHGYLQPVSAEYVRSFRLGRPRFVGDPTAPVSVAFVDAVADALLKCAQGKLEPARTYTLITNPQWTLGELVDVYREITGLGGDVAFEGAPPRPSRGAELVTFARDLADAHLFVRAPLVGLRAKGLYRVRGARREAELGPSERGTPGITSVLGACPGTLVPGLASTRRGAVESYRRIERRMAALLGDDEPVQTTATAAAHAHAHA